jgi:hypothetical protein|nr:MAG TPA: hypothetical protein [Caudoviricetes sp.]
MIDDKKIEEAAQGAADLYEQDLPIMSYNEDTEVDGQHHFCQEFGAELFKDGANWAINEFLKDLWHPASEEPRKDVSIIVETHNDKNMFYYAWNRWQDNFYPSWTDAVLCSRVSRWLYIDDLFPKKGGEK